jgi:hypothetical protein
LAILIILLKMIAENRRQLFVFDDGVPVAIVILDVGPRQAIERVTLVVQRRLVR